MIYNRILLIEIFKKLEVDFVGFDDGKKVFDYLSIHPADVVFLDIEMPVMNGLETATAIKNDLKLTIPVVSFTAHFTEEIAEKMKEVGFDYILYKPFTSENVKTILDDIRSKN